MISTAQDILYITVAASIGLFTVFLVWIMYYLAQISRQSNEMITDFRNKLEELDESITVIKEKVQDSVDALAGVSGKISMILDLVRSFTERGAVREKKTRR
jgi:predicted PurR-regulated permease PerM